MSPAHQSEHHVRRYKHPVQPSPGCLDDLRLMMLAGTLLHGGCIARTVGWWQVVTFVPSATRPGPEHVLVVDDTWVSGGKAQSAALTLKVAGASAVTIVCIGRWLSYRWDEHRPLIESLRESYDALRCPVTGGTCPTG